MPVKKIVKPFFKKITFHGLSIQQRLPLLVCVLLCIIILSFSFASYYGVKKAALEIGKNRLRSLTSQISSMFAQSSQLLVNSTLKIATGDSIKNYIRSDGKELQTEALEIISRLRHNSRDSTWSLVGLLDSDKKPLLLSGNETLMRTLSPDIIFSTLQVGPDSCKLGKLYLAGDSMYYPIVAAVTDNKQTTGYLIGWRLMSATTKGLEQLSQLMGTGATLYFGNIDGGFWTNLNKPVSRPPLNLRDMNDFFEYNDYKERPVLAAVKPIVTTQWLLLIEFSEKIILETANRFLKWIIIIGSIMIVLGIFITWLMSHDIIKPLNQLTNAATTIAAGDFSSTIEVNRMDELGKLANAFNSMAAQIRTTQEDLEKKIVERTIQLEKANKELESFSYSISHDLRAPLRGIAGFTSMLESRHADKLDDDGKRIISIISNNTTRMGNLIDDLLSFSKTARHDIVKANIPTNTLVKEVITDIDNKNQHILWYIDPLPDSYADINSIRQVWTNLISNAIKYSKNAESPSIEIGYFHEEGLVVFFVKDNGVGFDPKYKDKLFKVFQRLHSTNEFEGSGVGLAIVEKIISRHGGKVWVNAEKDKGATFYFSLPVKQL